MLNYNFLFFTLIGKNHNLILKHTNYSFISQIHYRLHSDPYYHCYHYYLIVNFIGFNPPPFIRVLQAIQVILAILVIIKLTPLIIKVILVMVKLILVLVKQVINFIAKVRDLIDSMGFVKIIITNH